MSTLFGIDFPSLISGVFTGQIEGGTLYVIAETLDDYGQPEKSATGYNVEGVVTSWDEKTRVSRGYPMEAVKILMLAKGKPKPVKGRDEITMRGQRWRIVDVSDGGAEAVWLIAAVATEQIEYPDPGPGDVDEW